MRVTALILGALTAISLSTPADAFGWRTCGDKNLRLSSNSLAVYAAGNSFPAGYWRDGLQNSINQFNRNPSNFYYSLYIDTNGLALGNGQSEIWGTTDQSILQNAPARAFSWWQCYWTPWSGYVAYMTEGDIIFDYTNTAANPFEWVAAGYRPNLTWYGGPRRLLQATSIHELGHAVGLLHENRTYNVMGHDFTHVHTNSTTTTAYIGEDTGNGTVFLYGLWAGGPNDLGVSHWTYHNADGEYSRHKKAVLTWPNGAALPYWFTLNGETAYWVRRGQVIRTNFSYENLGRAALGGISVRFYISTNDLISTGDQLAASYVNGTLYRDWVNNWLLPVTIPNNLTVGSVYYLGVYLNPTGAISESSFSNNATYIPIKIY